MDMLLEDIRVCGDELRTVIGLSSENIKLVYQHSTEKDRKLRDVLTCCAMRVTDDALHELFAEVNDPEVIREFQVELLFKTRERIFQPWTWITEQDPCHYHVHADEDSSYSCTMERQRKWDFATRYYKDPETDLYVRSSTKTPDLEEAEEEIADW